MWQCGLWEGRCREEVTSELGLEGRDVAAWEGKARMEA